MSSTLDYSAGAPNPSAPETTMSPASWVPPAAVSALLCFVLSLAMHLPWIGITPIAGTEGHRIFPAHHMVESHQWLVPMLFDVPFMTKPPFHHWLIAMSELAGGANVFFWRLPSAINGALLCAAACFFGARWFGRGAGLISGLCAVGMIAIWGQSQVADIDSTNTLASAVAALCGIELFFGSQKRIWIWAAGATAAITATWMAKGPAGMPVILGVWIWAAVVAIREKRARSLASPVFWLPIALAIAVFVGWGLAANAYLKHHGMAFDVRGVQEGSKMLFSLHVLAHGEALFVMLPELFAFALPVSAALPFFFVREVHEMIEPAHRRITKALVASVLISWGVYVLAGTANPRYAYPTLIPLCPLAGAVAVAMSKTRRAADWLKVTLVITCIGFAAGAIGLTVGAWKLPHVRFILIASSLLAIATAFGSSVWLKKSWNGAWGIVLLMMLTAIPFGAQRRWSRTHRDSGMEAGARLRSMIGEHTLVTVGGMATSKPETLTYANVRVKYFPGGFFPKNVHPGTWIVLDQAERKVWRRTPGIRLEREQWLCKNGQTDYYLAWFPGLQTPAPVP